MKGQIEPQSMTSMQLEPSMVSDVSDLIASLCGNGSRS